MSNSLQETDNTKEYAQKINQAVAFIRTQFGDGHLADVAIVLGSGLGLFSQRFKSSKTIPYSDIPNMVKTTVSGHSGTLILGTLENGNQILTFSGRVHAYEGIRMFEVTFLARLAHGLGCKVFIATNAAGGSLDQMHPGDAMIISDHINVLKRHPLQEVFGDDGVCPTSPSNQIYSPRIRSLARDIAKEVPSFRLLEGVYACSPGPSYETPSEVSGGKNIGIGAFGMSTVPECIVAKSLGMEVFAMSLCTNLAAGISSVPLSHKEVKEVADQSGPKLMKFMEKLLSELSANEDHVNTTLSSNDNSGITLNRVAKRATEQEINEAVQFLKEKRNGEYKVAVQIANQETSSFTESQFVKQTTTISLSDIPNYPNVASMKGTMILGENCKGVGILCLIPNAESGFLPCEACFLAQIFKELGIKIFFFTATVAKLKESNTSMYIIEDATDITTIKCYPPSASPTEFVPISLFNTDLISPRITNDEIGIGSYFQFTGPTTPTPAEQHIATCSDADIIGITSLQITYACRAYGIQVAGVAGVTRQGDELELVENSSSIYNQLNKLVDNCVRNCTIDETSKYDIVQGGSSISNYQIDYEIRDACQGDPSIVNPVIEQLKKLNITTGIIVHGQSMFDLFSKQVNDLTPVSLDNSDVFCPIYTATYADSSIFIIHQNRYYHQGYEFSEITSSIRAVAGAGITKLCILAPFYSVSDVTNVGDIVSIKDHVNICGRSPLFGHQVKNWGQRFPDMSSVWNSVTLETVNSVILGIAIGPLYYSPLDANYASSLLSQVVSTSVGWDALTAKHMNPSVSVTGLGIVTSSIYKKENINMEEKFNNLMEITKNTIF